MEIKDASVTKFDMEKHKEAKGKNTKNEDFKFGKCSSTGSPRNEYPRKRNGYSAENRLKKFRANLSEQVKLKDKVEKVGLDVIVNETVKALTKENKPKLHKLAHFSKTENASAYERSMAKGPAEGKSNAKVEGRSALRAPKDARSLVKNRTERRSAMKVPVTERSATKVSPQGRNIASKRLKKIQKKIETEKERRKIEIDSKHKRNAERSQFFEEKDQSLSSKRSPLQKETPVPGPSDSFDKPAIVPNLSVEDDMAMDVDMESCTDVVIPSPSQTSQIFTSPFNNIVNYTFENSTCSSSSNSCDIVNYMNTEIFKIRQEPMYQALHENFMSEDVEMSMIVPDGDLFIVIDTNIFLSHLVFLKKLLKQSIPPYKSVLMVVPWLVIQEIDYAMKKSDTRLASQARLANIFINECLKNRNPRFFGQSLKDFKENFKNAVCIDDFILQYSLKFTSFGKNVILLTDDKNLCTKAMVNQLPVFTKDDFEKRVLTDQI